MIRKAHSVARRAFTLVEMLVAVAVFALLATLIAAMIDHTSKMADLMGARVDSDAQARTLFGRMDIEIAAIPRTPNLDYCLIPGGSPPSDPSDQLYVYSRVPGYTSGTSPTGLTLSGYRVNTTTYALGHVAYSLSWDSILFLTFNPLSSGNFAPVAGGMLTPSQSPLLGVISDATNFHILSGDVFRMEIYYSLKDGTFSIEPVIGGAAVNRVSGPPSPANDVSQGYSVGSRWYDTSGQRGYVCESPALGQATWTTIGWDDVSAIVVTVAVLDGGNRKIVAASGKSLGAAAALLVKASDANLATYKLPTQQWVNTVESGGLNGVLPPKAASAVRIYQRTFFLAGGTP